MRADIERRNLLFKIKNTNKQQISDNSNQRGDE
jgi:hypothetical protein